MNPDEQSIMITDFKKYCRLTLQNIVCEITKYLKFSHTLTIIWKRIENRREIQSPLTSKKHKKISNKHKTSQLTQKALYHTTSS